MGNVRFGLPAGLAQELTVEYNLRVAVETGTYLGRSARTLATMVDRVHTIEQDDGLFLDARGALRDCPGITCHYGSSHDVLPAILPAVDEPAIFWFDAHWFPVLPKSGHEQCPVLAELQALAPWPWTQASVILIDDAHLFGTPPQFDGGGLGYRPEQWPNCHDIVNELVGSLGCRRPVVIDDVLVVTPCGRS